MRNHGKSYSTEEVGNVSQSHSGLSLQTSDVLNINYPLKEEHSPIVLQTGTNYFWFLD
jgi:hypothetical protein